MTQGQGNLATDTPGALWCGGCGHPLQNKAVSLPANSRPMSGAMRSAPTEFGNGRGDRFMALRSFSYVDSTGQRQNIKAGITFVSPKCEAFRFHPSADFWSA
jgi:hypothetical protein